MILILSSGLFVSFIELSYLFKTNPFLTPDQSDIHLSLSQSQNKFKDEPSRKYLEFSQTPPPFHILNHKDFKSELKSHIRNPLHAWKTITSKLPIKSTPKAQRPSRRNREKKKHQIQRYGDRILKDFHTSSAALKKKNHKKPKPVKYLWWFHTQRHKISSFQAQTFKKSRYSQKSNQSFSPLPLQPPWVPNLFPFARDRILSPRGGGLKTLSRELGRSCI